MATDLLKNVLTRLEKTAQIKGFPDWYITELKGFKKRWSTDMLVDVSDPDRPEKKKAESFKVVRVRHRVPDNRWITGGGWRHHPDVSLSQMESHAIEMSLKCWIMGIPHGGAKGGIAFDPSKYSEEDLQAITIKAATEAIEENTLGPYIDRWAPDVNTNEIIMKWIQDQFSYEMRKQRKPEPAAAVTGKPLNFGGMPGRKEATGRGLHYALRLFRKEAGLSLPEIPTVALQGFGNVGFNFAKLAREFNVKIVAVQDQFGGVYHPNLPLEELLLYVEDNRQKTVSGFHNICKGEEIKTAKELFTLPVDVVLPAALEETITADIAERIQAKCVLEGANGPTHPDADAILEERGITVIPDIFANAGGVLVSYYEWEKDTHIEPFDPLMQPPKYPEEGLAFASLQGAFLRNGKAIIHLRNATREASRPISYRLASYIYAMERVLPFFAMKRRKKI